jgi:tetratricopeptide (TPR) repeat protein
LALWPKATRALAALGAAYLHKGEIDKAIDTLERAAASAPEYSITFEYLGDALALQGRREAAAAAFSRAQETLKRERHHGPKSDVNELARKAANAVSVTARERPISH